MADISNQTKRLVGEVQADNPQARYKLGEAYLKIGREDLALEEYHKLKVIDEQLANDLLNLFNQQQQR